MATAPKAEGEWVRSDNSTSVIRNRSAVALYAPVRTLAHRAGSAGEVPHSSGTINIGGKGVEHWRPCDTVLGQMQRNMGEVCVRISPHALGLRLGAEQGRPLPLREIHAWLNANGFEMRGHGREHDDWERLQAAGTRPQNFKKWRTVHLGQIQVQNQNVRQVESPGADD
jgi:hypothetical protein